MGQKGQNHDDVILECPLMGSNPGYFFKSFLLYFTISKFCFPAFIGIQNKSYEGILFFWTQSLILITVSCPLSTKVLVTRQIFLTAAMSSVTQVYIFFFYLEHYDNTIRRKNMCLKVKVIVFYHSYQNLIMARFFYRKKKS